MSDYISPHPSAAAAAATFPYAGKAILRIVCLKITTFFAPLREKSVNFPIFKAFAKTTLLAKSPLLAPTRGLEQER